MYMQELIDKFIEQNNLHSFEGERGVRNFTTVVRALDPQYTSVDAFLSDNPGAMEALLNWIGNSKSPSPEWQLSLENQIDNSEDESDVDDDSYDEFDDDREVTDYEQ